jgi:hypothetical protein
LSDYYKYKLKYSEELNPVSKLAVMSYLKGLRNKLSKDSEFDPKRAHAFSYEDMEKTDKLLSEEYSYEAEFF